MVAPDWSLLSEVDGFEIGGVEKGRSGGGSNRAHRRLARPRKTDEQGLRRSSPQSGQSQTGRILAHDQPRIICRVGTVCARNSMLTAFQGTCWSNGLYLVQPEEFEPPTYRAESSSTSRLSGMSRARHCATSSIGPGGGRGLVHERPANWLFKKALVCVEHVDRHLPVSYAFVAASKFPIQLDPDPGRSQYQVLDSKA